MSKRSERLLIGLNDIDEMKLNRAAEYRPRSRWKRWTAIAAVLALVIGSGGWFAANYIGGCSEGGVKTGPYSYNGPILPLTLKEERAEISAERTVTLDFATWVPGWREGGQDPNALTAAERETLLRRYADWYGGEVPYNTGLDVLVEDAYVLTNSGGEDSTVKILYPFISSLLDHTAAKPTLTLDGDPLDVAVHIGERAGSFQTILDETGETLCLNLSNPAQWEDYQKLLSEPTYQMHAMAAAPDLSQIPVVVYEFSNAHGPEPTEKIPNPSIRVRFDMDYAKTRLLTWGFSGSTFAPAEGYMIQEFSTSYQKDGSHSFFFVLGDDIEAMTTGGYVTGGTDPDTPALEGTGVTVERYTSDLETQLRRMLTLRGGWERKLPEIDFETRYAILAAAVETDLLSRDRPQRYDTGELELFFSDTELRTRVNWAEATIQIPAGESRTVTASYRKMGNFTYGEERNMECELATTLGSNLRWTAQQVKLVDRGQIQLTQQNCGFDLEQGVYQVTLDPKISPYTMTVTSRKK